MLHYFIILSSLLFFSSLYSAESDGEKEKQRTLREHSMTKILEQSFERLFEQLNHDFEDHKDKFDQAIKEFEQNREEAEKMMGRDLFNFFYDRLDHLGQEAITEIFGEVEGILPKIKYQDNKCILETKVDSKNYTDLSFDITQNEAGQKKITLSGKDLNHRSFKKTVSIPRNCKGDSPTYQQNETGEIIVLFPLLENE